MISMSAVVWAVFWLIGAGLIFGVLYWLLGKMELEEPFNKVARIILYVGAAAVVIGVILSLMGGPQLFRP